jgi:hypothetical protein
LITRFWASEAHGFPAGDQLQKEHSKLYTPLLSQCCADECTLQTKKLRHA